MAQGDPIAQRKELMKSNGSHAKDVNQMIVDSHFRPRTVVLFTHSHSLAAFREALPPTLRVAESINLKRKASGVPFLDSLVGGGPWGLCDIVVLEPVNPPARDSLAE